MLSSGVIVSSGPWLQLRAMSGSVALLHSVSVDVCESIKDLANAGSRILPGTMLISEGYAAVEALLVRMIYIATRAYGEIWSLTVA